MKPVCGQALKRNRNSINTAAGRDGVQGCACHGGGCSERSSGCRRFDAVTWNGRRRKGHSPSLCLVCTSASPPSLDPQQTHRLRLHPSPDDCSHFFLSVYHPNEEFWFSKVVLIRGCVNQMFFLSAMFFYEQRQTILKAVRHFDEHRSRLGGRCVKLISSRLESCLHVKFLSDLSHCKKSPQQSVQSFI